VNADAIIDCILEFSRKSQVFLLIWCYGEVNQTEYAFMHYVRCRVKAEINS